MRWLALVGGALTGSLAASAAPALQSLNLNEAYNASLASAQAGDLEGAADSAAQALAIADEQLGPEHAQTGILALNLGRFYTLLKLDSEAQPVLERAVAIYGANYGDDSPRLISPLGSLAEVYVSLGLHDRAYETHERIVSLSAKQYGDDSIELARALGPPTEIAFRMGQTKAVRSHLRRALRIWRKQRGKDSVEVGEVTFFLALNDLADGNLRNAQENMERAVKILEQKLPEGDPQKIEMYRTLVQMNEQFGRAAVASEYREKLEANQRVAREASAPKPEAASAAPDDDG